MAFSQCEKCGETVDEAKAFCPACGHAFVDEEKRQEASKFEKLDRTVQFGQTMYNQMLEDMGLDISNLPKPAEKRVETIAPVNATPVVPPVETQPAAPTQPVRKPKEPAPKTERGGKTKWYILIGVGVIILLPIAILSTIFVVLQLLSRLR